MSRIYLYTLTSRGTLHLYPSRSRNFTSAYRDPAFLDFFFHRLKPNDTSVHTDFPYVSPCGHEQNYLKLDEGVTPLVFTALHKQVAGTSHSLADVPPYLSFFGTKKMDFDPSTIAVSEKYGTLMHRVPAPYESKLGKWGLLSDSITTGILRSAIEHGGGKLGWQGKQYPIEEIE